MSNYVTITDLPSLNLSDLSGNEYFIINDNTTSKILLSDLSNFITNKNTISVNNNNLGYYTNINFTGIAVSNNNGIITVPLETKVDKISGKGLSTEDFTTDYKNKIDNPLSFIPVADSENLGLVKIGNGIDLTEGTISVNVSWNEISGTPTSLADFGISDVYDKNSVDDLLLNKQDKNSKLTSISNLNTNGFIKYHNGNIISDNNTYLTGNQIITISGDLTGQGNTNIEATLKDSGVVAGTYSKLTVNSKGIITSGINVTNISDLGITNVYTKSETDSRIQDIIGTAPANLDTLAEIATQLSDDESVVSALITTVSNKVDKISGKGLSTEDFTTTEKSKLAGIASGAEVNVNSDWNATSGDAQILNKPTTIGGYGITDAYTKTEVQTVLPIIGLDITANQTVNTGQITWNSTEGTADLGLLGGSVLQIGQENVRTVRNASGSLITNGTVCMFDGTIGNSGRIKVKPFTGGFNEAIYVYGVATQDIPNGSDGLITIEGKVRGIDTTGANVGETWSDNDILYAKPGDAGKLTKVLPAVTELRMPMAAVVHSHTNGTLEIRFTPINENQFEPRNANIQAHISSKSNPHGVTKTQVGLGNVDNTSDVNKPISSATQTALDLKAPLANPTFTGTVTGITKSMVGLENVDNTSDVSKNVLSATKLTTAITINGVSFDGSANISINTNNSQIIKFDTGTTEGTDLYTFNGNASKTIDIKAGTNITLTKTAGSITISANDTSVGWSEITSKPTTLSGYGITDSIQSTLVSGTNIVTINNNSILGSGNLFVGYDINSVEFLTTMKRGTKPVYGIEIDAGTLLNASEKSVAFTFNGTYIYWIDSQMSYCKSSTEILSLPHSSPNVGEQIGVKLDLTNNLIKISSGIDRTSYSAKIVLLYTK